MAKKRFTFADAKARIKELEEQIVEQIKVLTEELGGTLKQLTRANSTGRMCKVIEIEYNIINQ